MPLRFLLDTNIVVRWLTNPEKLSREQKRALGGAVRLAEPVALSAISLIEMALLVADGKLEMRMSLDQFFAFLESQPTIIVLPLTFEIASEIAAIGSLRDPGDRTIVATARVHRLRLITSDQRLIDSGLVPTVE